MASKDIGYLGYNSDNDRMGILNDMDLWEEEGLHCGFCLEAWIDGAWVSDRLEYNGNWRLDYTKLEGRELEGLKVRY